MLFLSFFSTFSLSSPFPPLLTHYLHFVCIFALYILIVKCLNPIKGFIFTGEKNI